VRDLAWIFEGKVEGELLSLGWSLEADDLKEELSSSADEGSVRPNGVQATPLDTVGLLQGRGEAQETDSASVTDGHQGLV